MRKNLTLTLLALLLAVTSFALSPIVGITNVCVGSVRMLADSTPGGTWSSSNPAIATVAPTSGAVTGVSAGVVTISYMLGGTWVTTPFTVNPVPPAIIGATHLTVGSSIFLSDAMSGGSWSSSCPSILGMGSIAGMVTGVGAGICNVTYTLPTGCYRTITDTVTGGGGSISPITGTNHVCVGSAITLTDSTSGGTWSSSNTSVATVGTLSGMVTGISVGTCVITYTVGTSFVTMPFTVSPLPIAISGPSVVSVGGTITLVDGTPGGTWISSNTTKATVTSAGIVTGISAGTVEIYYQLTTGCAVHYSITVSGVSVSPITGTLHGCVGSTTPLSDSTAGGTWSSSNMLVATVNATTGVVTGIAVGTCTISYTVGITVVTASFTVAAAPLPITGMAIVTVGGAVTLADATAGGTWTSSSPGVATVGAFTGVVTGISAGTATIYYTLTTGCSVSYVITVSGAITLPISGVNHVCLGSTTTLHDSTTGGSWSSSNTAIATVGSLSGTVTGVAAGTCTITYTHGSSFSTISFTVYPLPATPLGLSAVMVGGTITLTDASTGGYWTSGNTSIATVGSLTGIVTGISAGTVWIYYNMTTGCTSYKAITVAGGSSVLPITGTTNACVGGTTTLHDSTSGGSWSSSNTLVATINATTGVVTGVAAGTCTISYTVGTTSVTTSFTVSALPLPIIGLSTVSAGSSITLSDAVAGGSWSSSNLSVATVNPSTGVVTGISAGTVTIYYTLPGGCSVSRVITVTGTGTTMPIWGTFSTCIGSSTTLHDSTAGGTWSSSNPAIATVGSSTGVVLGLSAGTCTISYSVGTSVVTAAFAVYAAPAAIAGLSTVGTGATITLTDATPGGTWVSGNTGVATVSATGIVTGMSAGTVNIYYTTLGGCAVYKTITVTGTILPIFGVLHGCVGTTTALHDSTSGGTWSSSAPAVATVGATTGVVTGIAAGTCIISYTVGTTTTTASFTVYAVPAAIGGSSAVCAGASITLTDATAGGVWSSSNPAIATVMSTSGVVTGAAAGTVTIYYALTTGCGAAKTVVVNPAPTPIAGSSTVCVGAIVSLSDGVPGGTWTSVYTARATVVAGTGLVTGVSAGTTTIIYSVAGCSTSMTLTVGTAPALITGASTVCMGSSISLTDLTPGGTWISGSPAIATVSSTGVVTGITAGVLNVYYTVGGCSVSKTITVNPMPAAITGSSSVHVSGTPITLSESVSGGSWFSGNTTIATVGALTGIVNGVHTGTVNIYYSIGGCAVYKVITVLAAGPRTAIENEADGLVPVVDNADVVSAPEATGIATVDAKSKIAVYPNPTGGNINLQWEGLATGNAQVTITDVVGRVVFSTELTIVSEAGQTQLNLDNMKDGIYLISVKSDRMALTSRIVVQH